jgi:lipoprotein-releasing system permease protein
MINLPLYIAKRYLLAKKSHNLINVITAVSVTGVAVGAFALIVVLSVFNGFEVVISQMVNAVAPDLLVLPSKGKTVESIDFPFEAVAKMKGVKAYTEIIEEDALFRYGEKQHIGRIKGVGESYQQQGLMTAAMVEGDFILKREGFQFAVVGAGVAWYLGMNVKNPSDQLLVYVPRAGGQATSLDQGFSNRAIQAVGVYASQQDYDARYVYVPLEWARELLGMDQQFSGVEIFLDETVAVQSVQKQLQELLGGAFSVKDRFQQQATLYQIMRTEKWAIFIILTFILIMATFNVIGSLTMLIVDKQKDTSVLKSFGAPDSLIRKLFLTEGILISVAGGLAGLVLGIVLVIMQQQFGLLKLGNGTGSFVIDAYPVHLALADVVSVFFIVTIIGGISSVYTVWQAMRRRKSIELMKDM